MTVQDLIDELKKMDSSAEILITSIEEAPFDYSVESIIQLREREITNVYIIRGKRIDILGLLGKDIYN
jgi:hypothetical protein